MSPETFVVSFLVVCNFLASSGLAQRYGTASQDVCPNSGDPQKTREGNIVWCKRDSDCQLDYACTPIEGLTHFGIQIKHCCPNRIAVCSLPPQPGYGECGKKPMTMYYFDVTSLRCQPFTVVACNGLNGNRFPSLSECKRRCEATACHKGESPLLISSDFNQPVLCGESGLCPAPYKCRYDKLFRRHVCCGYKREGACPGGTRSYMNVLTNRPKRCRQNSVRDGCPVDYVCASPGDSDVSFCCAKDDGVCPTGRPPYIHPLTDHTMKCHPSVNFQSECPYGYACVASVPGSNWGFCCLDIVDDKCPLGTIPQIDKASNLPQKCVIGRNTCSFGFSCQTISSLSPTGFCCSNKPKSTTTALDIIVNDPSPTPAPGLLVTLTTQKPKLKFHPKPTRLVDIQKKIDKSEIKRLQKKQKPSKRSFLECPYDRKPVVQANFLYPLQCLAGVSNKCPPKTECLKAPKDPLGRHICCHLSNDEGDIFKAKLQLSTTRKTKATKGIGRLWCNAKNEVAKGEKKQTNQQSIQHEN
ncbi:hypothetical protein L596_029747 [Steinernema carpocapsae]|uniref:BPTI/Kunitz inhibitor domain-containing protein n=1 Tax=Steinernema carpocapsae TaxID=34508 RepID=A0A4U5LQP8_STECR|nr:hypothetical protein L596_029747 [Steinernema carpocapsae]